MQSEAAIIRSVMTDSADSCIQTWRDRPGWSCVKYFKKYLKIQNTFCKSISNNWARKADNFVLHTVQHTAISTVTHQGQRKISEGRPRPSAEGGRAAGTNFYQSRMHVHTIWCIQVTNFAQREGRFLQAMGSTDFTCTVFRAALLLPEVCALLRCSSGFQQCKKFNRLRRLTKILSSGTFSFFWHSVLFKFQSINQSIIIFKVA